MTVTMTESSPLLTEGTVLTLSDGTPYLIVERLNGCTLQIKRVPWYRRFWWWLTEFFPPVEADE
jgi:hypothetical protein